MQVIEAGTQVHTQACKYSRQAYTHGHLEVLHTQSTAWAWTRQAHTHTHTVCRPAGQ